MIRQILAFIVFAALCTQCTVAPRYARQSNPITESLFNDKDRTLSEESIKTLLDGKLVLPDTLRFAVFIDKRINKNCYDMIFAYR